MTILILYKEQHEGKAPSVPFDFLEPATLKLTSLY